jgi:hypothetical protein
VGFVQVCLWWFSCGGRCGGLGVGCGCGGAGGGWGWCCWSCCCGGVGGRVCCWVVVVVFVGTFGAGPPGAHVFARIPSVEILLVQDRTFSHRLLEALMCFSGYRSLCSDDVASVVAALVAVAVAVDVAADVASVVAVADVAVLSLMCAPCEVSCSLLLC